MPSPTNLEVALKAEAKKVIRCFQPYSSDQRANHAASFRLGHRQREAVGHFFYMHPAIGNRAIAKAVGTSEPAGSGEAVATRQTPGGDQ